MLQILEQKKKKCLFWSLLQGSKRNRRSCDANKKNGSVAETSILHDGKGAKAPRDQEEGRRRRIFVIWLLIDQMTVAIVLFQLGRDLNQNLRDFDPELRRYLGRFAQSVLHMAKMEQYITPILMKADGKESFTAVMKQNEVMSIDFLLFDHASTCTYRI